MPTTKVEIYDELGNPWKVAGGAPASRLVNRLVRDNYRLIVLPLVALATGRLGGAYVEPEDIIRSTRLRDCLDALEVMSA